MGRDIRFALRNLRKNPGVSAVAALSLALGIGANTAIFSAIHGTLLRPLPYSDPGRLAMLWLDNRRLGLHEDLTSYPNYEDWRKNRAFVDLAGFVPTDSIMTGMEEPARVADALVTSNFLSVLGATESAKVAGMMRDEVRALDKSAVLFERSTIARFTLAAPLRDASVGPVFATGVDPGGGWDLRRSLSIRVAAHQ